jgi:sugar lactone lactonase YvrE
LASIQELDAALAEASIVPIEGTSTDAQAAEGLPHDDLDRDGAEDLFRAAFPSAIEETAGIFTDLSVAEFHSDYSVVVPPVADPDVAGAEPAGLLTSTLPLRAENPEGTQEIVDLDLEPAGDDGALRPGNPIVEVEIPAQLEEGISLPETGIKIQLADAPDGRGPSVLEESSAFFPNVAPDTDLSVAAAPTGFETFTQLRSVDAPRSQTFDLTLPEDASLQATEDGGALVTRAGEVLLSVRAPAAIDAEGEPVPATLHVSGDSIVLEVAPDDDSAFPVLVDPLYETYQWLPKGSTAGIGDWVSASNTPSITATTAGAWGAGLALKATLGAAFPGAQANWNYYVPRYFADSSNPSIHELPTSFIKHATLSDVYYGLFEVPVKNNYPALWVGLWDGRKGAWASFGERNASEGPISTPATIELVNPNEVTDVKNGGLALATVEYQSHPRQAMAGQATVEISDTDDPEFLEVVSPQGWVNQAATPIQYAITDPGLGIYQLQVKQPNFGGGMTEVTTSNQCVGNVSSPCPRVTKTADRQVTYEPVKIPTGERFVEVTATDPIGHKSEVANVKVKVDHSSPDLVVSGTATEQATLGVRRPSYGIKAQATDGTESIAESGVTKALIEFDGVVVASKESGCATKNCAASVEWTINSSSYAPGSHELKVTATDGVGLKATKTITVELEPVPPTISVSGSITEQASLGFSRPRYNLKLNATAESGIEVEPGTAEPVRNLSFGSSGTGNGQFSKPGDAAVDAKGNLYVLDPNNNRVEVFNEQGVYLRKFGSTGSGNGQFNRPAAIAVEPAGGNVWVVDAGNARVQQFTPEGAYLRSFGSVGSGNGQFAGAGPEGIAISPSGTIYVTDTYAGRIEKFGSKGEFLGVIGVKGTGVGQLSKPTGIDVGPGGKLLVSDCTGSKVLEFEENGTFIRQFGSYGTNFGQFKCPGSIVADQRNGIWVADTEIGRIQAFNMRGKYATKIFASAAGLALDAKSNLWLSGASTSSGQLVQRWGLPFYISTYESSFGKAGIADGQFSHPADIARDSKGNLYVVDQNSKRIQVFNEQGVYLRKFGSNGTGPGQFTRPSAIAIDSKDNVYVTDAGESVRRVEQFNSEGGFLKSFGSAGTGPGQFGASGPEGIAIDSKGAILVTDRGNGRIEKFNEKGEFLSTIGTKGTGAGQLMAPTGIDIGPGNKPWVTDYTNNKVVIFSEGGEYLQQFGSTGAGDGQFSGPDAIAVDDHGDAWVIDLKNNRVEQFGEGGTFISKFGSTGSGAGQFNFGSPTTGLVADNLGRLWLTDANNNRIQRWGQSTPQSEVSTEISVDGKLVDSSGAICKTEKCPITREWSLQSSAYSPGSHTVLAKATDGFGNVTTKSVSVTLKADVVKPFILTMGGELPNAPEGWVEQDGSYSFNASAADGGYGVTSLVLRIDGQAVASTIQTCPDGACQATLSKPISLAGYSGGSHAATLVATDGAGNTASKGWTINVDPDGTISVQEAEETLEAVDETSLVNTVGPSEEEEEYEGTGDELSLEAIEGGEFAAPDSLAPTYVDAEPEDGFEVEIPQEDALEDGCEDPERGESTKELTAQEEEGLPTNEQCTPVTGLDLDMPELEPIEITPVQTSSSATDLALSDGEDAAISANVATHVDLVTRPLSEGGMTFAAIRDAAAPESYSWQVNLDPEQELKLVDSQRAQVYWSGGQVAFSIKAVPAHDAIGTTVPTSLSVSGGNMVTLTVAHRGPSPAGGSFIYPVVGGAGWQGGFQTYQIVMPPPEVGGGGEEEEGEVGIGSEGGAVPSVKIISGGPPIAQASGAPVDELSPGPKTAPRLQKKFKFTYCFPREIPGDPLSGTLPTNWWNSFKGFQRASLGENYPHIVSECHREDFHGVYWGVSAAGWFHYVYRHWVWAFPAQWDCRKWGQEQPAEVNCRARSAEAPQGPAGAVHGPLDVFGQYRFHPTQGHFAGGDIKSTCLVEGGSIYPNPRRAYEAPYERPMIIEHEYVTPVVAQCDWPALVH